jgi:hypothetical protein
MAKVTGVSGWRVAVWMGVLGLACNAGAASAGPWRFAGYDKTIVLTSDSADPDSKPYDSILNRLRLKLDYEVPHWQVHVEDDLTFKAGSYLSTTDFQREKTAPSRLYWNDARSLGDGSSYYGTQQLFRAYVKWSGEATDLTVGRQRIPLGTGLMWSTLDMLNPINPLQVERDEYIGVDAALLAYRVDATSRFSVIYAPDPAHRQDRWVGQYRTNVSGTDLNFTYGKYWGDHLLGLDVATQIGDAGLRGELTITRPQTGPSYRKALLGLDYAFVNTLTLSAEFYYSSQSKADRLEQFAQNAQLAQVQPLSSRYAGFSASYEITPLLKAAVLALYNRADHGRFISPTLAYSITENVVISGGAQFYSGSKESDFGRGKNLSYVQVQWFF